MKVFFASCALVFLSGIAPSARAFPPAPGFTICGTARDSFGWALRHTDGATVIVKKGTKVIAESPVDERLRIGENFRVLVPLDTDPNDAYVPAAQMPGALITLEVKFDSGTVPVTSLTTAQQTIGQPGGKLVVDFTIGIDSDGDGIPDSWEYWQLDEAGVFPGDPVYSLDTFTKTGDYDNDGTSDYVEYLAGTFAFLTDDNLRMSIVEVGSDGWVKLKSFAVVDKTYGVEGSDDLVNWDKLEICIDGSRSSLVKTFKADDTYEVEIETPRGTGEARKYYRLALY